MPQCEKRQESALTGLEEWSYVTNSQLKLPEIRGSMPGFPRGLADRAGRVRISMSSRPGRTDCSTHHCTTIGGG